MREAMSEAIPEDVMKVARKLRRGLCLDECTFDNGCGCLSDIASAILAERLAERERCAKICDEADCDAGLHAYGKFFATALRSGGEG